MLRHYFLVLPALLLLLASAALQADREALAEVLWENVYSKLDVKTYGQ